MVKRYGLVGDFYPSIGEVEDGHYVRHEDYAALEAELARLNDLYKKMTQSRDDWRDIAKRAGAIDR